jgi:hypothetical protein
MPFTIYPSSPARTFLAVCQQGIPGLYEHVFKGEYLPDNSSNLGGDGRVACVSGQIGGHGGGHDDYPLLNSGYKARPGLVSFAFELRFRGSTHPVCRLFFLKEAHLPPSPGAVQKF